MNFLAAGYFVCNLANASVTGRGNALITLELLSGAHKYFEHIG
jgi:hypothetical protein